MILCVGAEGGGEGRGDGREEAEGGFCCQHIVKIGDFSELGLPDISGECNYKAMHTTCSQTPPAKEKSMVKADEVWAVTPIVVKT